MPWDLLLQRTILIEMVMMKSLLPRDGRSVVNTAALVWGLPWGHECPLMRAGPSGPVPARRPGARSQNGGPVPGTSFWAVGQVCHRDCTRRDSWNSNTEPREYGCRDRSGERVPGRRRGHSGAPGAQIGQGQ